MVLKPIIFCMSHQVSNCQFIHKSAQWFSPSIYQIHFRIKSEFLIRLGNCRSCSRTGKAGYPLFSIDLDYCILIAILFLGYFCQSVRLFDVAFRHNNWSGILIYILERLINVVNVLHLQWCVIYFLTWIGCFRVINLNWVQESGLCLLPMEKILFNLPLTWTERIS